MLHESEQLRGLAHFDPLKGILDRAKMGNPPHLRKRSTLTGQAFTAIKGVAHTSFRRAQSRAPLNTTIDSTNQCDWA
jgi:hypothetical protein